MTTQKDLSAQMDANIVHAIMRVLEGYRDEYIYIDIAGEGNGHYKVLSEVERLERLRVQVKSMYKSTPRYVSRVTNRRPIKSTIAEFKRDREFDNAEAYTLLTGVK